MSKEDNEEYTLSYGPNDAVIVIRHDGDATAIIPHNQDDPDEELSETAITATVLLCLLGDETMIDTLAKMYFEDDLEEEQEDDPLTN